MSSGLRPLVCGCFVLLCYGIGYVTVQAEETRQVVSIINEQTQKQKEIQAETERTARRIGTVLRMLSYHKIDKLLEQKLLQETADTLSKLSREEMNAVLNHLEAAAVAPDPKSADAQQLKAYQKHREVVDQLKTLLIKYDLIKTLDVAADRLERASRAQNELQITAVGFSAEIMRDRRFRQRPVEDYLEHADGQHDLNRDVDNIFTQLGILDKRLDDGQRARLRNSDAFSRGKKLSVLAKQAYDFLKQSNPQGAAPKQETIANELLELSHALRTPRDPLEVLREARTRVDKTLQEQEDLRNQTAKPPENRKGQRDSNLEIMHAREMSQKQARVEFDTKDTRNLLKDASKVASDSLKPAEGAMRKAVDELRKTTSDFSKPLENQDKASEALKEAKKTIEDLIAKEEQKRTDPLEAVKAAAEQVDQLIKDQTKTRDSTEQTKGTQTEKMPALSKEQKNLSQRTNNLRNTPLPEKQEVKESLEKANKAMDKAAKALDNKKGFEAVQKQDDALKDLEAAKKALEDQAKAIEERRAEIAALEEAAKKLGELAKQQGDIADKARDQDKQGKTDKADMLAKNQGELKPQAKEVGEMIKDLVPEASKKIDRSGEKMDVAKNKLENKQLPPAAQNGDQAKQKLEEAQKDVNDELEKKKAMEAIDQQALQPKQIDPQNAAQQLTKALEQAQRAEQQSNRAAEQLNQKPMNDPMQKNKSAELQKLQQQVADKAKDLQQPKARDAAQKAARDLQKGDLQQAVENQQKALESLPEQGMGEPKEGMGEPKPSEAKTPDQLAKAQQQIQKATQALQKSQQANNAAQAALQQAKAAAPKAVQPQISQAQQKLQKAQQQLSEYCPTGAGQSQQEAQQALTQALNTLNEVQQQQQARGMGMGMPMPGMGGMPMPGMGEPKEGMGMGMGMGMGEPKEGMGMGMGKEKGQSQERNTAQGKGDRQADGKLKNSGSGGLGAKGDGNFINLPTRQREMIQQALNGQLPPEYGAMIRQYYMNLNNKKPAVSPATPNGGR